MTIRPNISPLIPAQFPTPYAGSPFVEFVRSYYEWMEQTQNPTGLIRGLLTNTDVDTTVDQFLVYMKQQYLADIQLSTDADTRLLIKHSQDLYSSRGTPRGLTLFFQSIFGVQPDIYVPSTDIMRLSAANWVRDTYLEITPRVTNNQFIEQEILGLTSGAIGYVERLVRRKINGKPVEALYISATSGQFITGETICINGQTNTPSNPAVVGSLTNLEIVEGGSGFAVGDVVELQSTVGTGGLARVSALATVLGTITFNLNDGGWGYTTQANAWTSQQVLRLANVNCNWDIYPIPITGMVQPQANLSYTNASAIPQVGDVLTTYANGVVTGQAAILMISPGANTSNGSVLVSTSSGNLQSNVIVWGPSNTYSAQTISWQDQTATGQVVGLSSNATLQLIDLTANLHVQQQVYQVDGRGWESANAVVVSVNPAANSITLSNVQGIFVTGQPVYAPDVGQIAIAGTADLDVGIMLGGNSFVSTPGNYVYDPFSGASGTIIELSQGSGAVIQPNTSALAYAEAVNLNTDSLSGFVNVSLAANSFGGTLGAANLNSSLTVLNYTTFTLGSIAKTYGVNPGSGYNYPPFVEFYDPITAPYAKRDYYVNITLESGYFQPDEVITQAATGATGLIKNANTGLLSVQRIQFEDKWQANTSANGYLVVGSSSGATAWVNEVYEDKYSEMIGMNADVTSNTAISNSAVLSLQIMASGFGYEDGLSVNFTNSDGTSTGTALVNLGLAGQSNGYYATTDGFLSDVKKLPDGTYYQDFSYVIKSQIPWDLYGDMLKKIMHVSGTAVFAEFASTDVVGGPGTITSVSTVGAYNGSGGGSFSFAGRVNSGLITLL